MGISFSDIFAPDTIIANTINGWIYFHPALVVGLYLAIVCVFAGGMYLKRKQLDLRCAAKKSIVVSLFCVGIIYAFLSEIIWTRWFVADVSLFQGLSSSQKHYAVEGDMYRFIEECRKIINGNDYSLYENLGRADTLERYFKDKLEYYLLPSRKKAEAQYVIVFYDNTTLFDESTGVLYKNDVPISAVKVMYSYSPDVYLARVQQWQ